MIHRPDGIWTSTRKRFSHSAAESNLLNLIANNPDLELGSSPGWTLTNIFIDTSGPLTGSYSMRAPAIGSATSSKYPCTAGSNLLASFLVEMAFAANNMSGSVNIRFYNATPTLLSTTVIQSWTNVKQIVINTFSITATPPVGTTQFEIYINITDDTGGGPHAFRFDNFVVIPTG